MPRLNNLVVTLLGVLSYLGTTVALLQPSRLHLTPAPHGEEEEPPLIVGENHDASWNYSNPEIDRLVVDLHRARAEVEKQRHELDALAARLQNERHEISQVTNLVHQMQADLDRSVLYIRKNEEANLKRLAKLYTAMTAKGALTILRQFEDDKIVKIFFFMKEADSAALIEALAKEGPENLHRAATLADRLRLTMQEAENASQQ